MKFPVTSTFALLLTLLLSFAGFAEDLTKEKREQIDIMLELTGADKIGRMFSEIYIRQVNQAIAQQNPNVDPRVFGLVAEEVNMMVEEHVEEKNAINNLIYPIYHRYLTLDEIKEMIAFYKTPLGKKILTTMPKITQEGMQAGQTWGKSIAPELQQRIQARFEKEGIRVK